MTKIVVDTNVVFSAILNTNSKIGQILISGHKYYQFFAPSYLRTEILTHKEKLKGLSGISENEFIELYEMIMRHVTVLNRSVIPKAIFKEALKICHNIDLDDTEFVASVEYIQGSLWTGDKKLINGLKNKSFDHVISSDELFQDFISKLKNQK